MMLISVILCTYNRQLYLAKVLDSIAGSVLPQSVDWEVLIIDNNSSDRTAEIAREFVLRCPDRFHYIFEPQQGKSYALNRGIREARGDVLAFVDDDVKVDPEWLWNLTKALEDGSWAGVGGRTLLAEHFSPPRWLALSGAHSLLGILAAVFDLGDEPCALDKPPYGANMAYRKEIFNKYGLFRTDMGPSADPEIPRPNEDTEFGRRVMAAGEHLRYEPSAVVYHPVPRDRIRKDYFLSWWFDYGRAAAREVGKRRDILGIQRRYWTIAKIVVVMLTVNSLRWILQLDPPKRFFSKCLVWMAAGQIVEVYRHCGPARPARINASTAMKAAPKIKL